MGSLDSTPSKRLARFLSDPCAASLVLAGLVVIPSDRAENFTIAKPKSTTGNSLQEYETWVIGCNDHVEWGGICLDAPPLTLRECVDGFIVEHLVVCLGGAADLLSNPGSFRESFQTLDSAVDFIMRFFFRDPDLFLKLTAT